MADIIFLAGCERSGTNYIQWLLKENFSNIMILTTEKHYEPRGIIKELDWSSPDFTNIVENNRSLQQKIREYAYNASIINKRGFPPLAFVSNEYDAPTLHKSDDVEKHVQAAMMTGKMNFIVNIKNPYGWHLSYTKHWPRIKYGSSMKHWTDLYEEWQKFEKKHSEKTLFVKHEDALRDFNRALDIIKEKFNLTRKLNPYITPQKRLSTISGLTNNKFNRKDYFEKEMYKKGLLETKRQELDACRDVISKELVKRFGYEIL